jgi:hypothetical protein
MSYSGVSRVMSVPPPRRPGGPFKASTPARHPDRTEPAPNYRRGKAMTRAWAVRAAINAGMASPEGGVDRVKTDGDIEVGKRRF